MIATSRTHTRPCPRYDSGSDRRTIKTSCLATDDVDKTRLTIIGLHGSTGVVIWYLYRDWPSEPGAAVQFI